MLWFIIVITFGLIFFIAIFGETEKKELKKDAEYFKKKIGYDYK